ncbi:MAG: deoxyribose-phosphate aldolase [Phycisphaeraceae bacterium]|nr:deoxyribose-phosphate aldolase [Phycisphaerae bacterium]MBX3391401.1 deoxyribose-phosphate aldolase [Phycisphaeraceae bacterium]
MATRKPGLFPSPTVDAVMAGERAASFTRRSIKASAKMAGLRLALSMLDLTTLEGKDSPEKVRALCRKAVRPLASDPDLPSAAAVCVYPSLVKTARESLGGSGVKVASVATGFPSGQYPIDVRLDDVRRAVDDGADEIDMVINRGAFLSGRHEEVADEIRRVKIACGTAHLKVILETGELETLDNVRRASDLAIRAMSQAGDPGETRDGDFIKTSTGKVQPAATMPVTLVMLEAIRDWYLETGRVVGMKPAGGIRTAKQALHYLVMVKETMGHLAAPGSACPWLTPAYFRFGASTLCNDILRQVDWLRGGRYRAAYDYTES